LSLAAPEEEIVRILQLRNDNYMLASRSSTFHGRDVFAPAAAHVSRGVAVEQLGPAVTGMERITLPAVAWEGKSLTGCAIYIDHFGNVVTNIAETDLRPFSRENLLVSIRTVQIHGIAPTYATVDVGVPVAVINSWGMLEIAVRNGSAAQQCGIQIGDPVHLTT
jgi:S-adenosyl-L-methionine hydrolase (adenosine-forming)